MSREESVRVLPMRRRAEVVNDLLRSRLDTVLPLAMREAGIDMWIVLCQEDNPDPVFSTLIPMDTWCPILQILVFYDRGGASGIERTNISGTDTHDLYERPYRGQIESEQWPILSRMVEERKPRRIGIDIGEVQWAAGGLTYDLHRQLLRRLPSGYAERLVSAEPLVTRWLATLCPEDLVAFEHVVEVAHGLIAECYSPQVIVPGITTLDELMWYYWQRAADLGLEPSFKPHFGLIRSDTSKTAHGESDRIIRHGDVVHCDVGIKYLRLNSDHQQLAYIRRPGEEAPPAGLARLMGETVRLQDIFMSEFRQGLTGNELLRNILSRARSEDIPGAKVYSHSLGYYLHEPGPLIGLPWEQSACAGRGDVVLRDHYAFTMELSVTGPVAEWGGQQVRLPREEDVEFADGVCRPIGGRQTSLRLL